jgi:hypothetical protein
MDLYNAYEIFFNFTRDDKIKLPFPVAFKINTFLDNVQPYVQPIIAERNALIDEYAKFDMTTGKVQMDSATNMPFILPEYREEFNERMNELFNRKCNYSLDPDLYFTKDELKDTIISIPELEVILWMIK